MSFYHIPSKEFSVIGEQQSSTIIPYQTASGTELLLISEGNVDAKVMFNNTIENNTVMTWALRFMGVLFMYFGFFAMGSLLPTKTDVVPFIGSIVGLGVKVFAGVVSFFFSMTIIGMAWLYYRPLLGGILMAIGLAVGLIFYKKSLNNRSV